MRISLFHPILKSASFLTQFISTYMALPSGFTVNTIKWDMKSPIYPLAC